MTHTQRRARARVDHARRRFDSNLLTIRVSCDCTEELVIPDLEERDVVEAIATLSTSIAQISNLIRRLCDGSSHPPRP
jgi:hypothetical protein